MIVRSLMTKPVKPFGTIRHCIALELACPAYVIHIEDAEQKIACRDSLGIEVNVQAAFQLPIYADKVTLNPERIFCKHHSKVLFIYFQLLDF
jgi:hypothetical protein